MKSVKSIGVFARVCASVFCAVVLLLSSALLSSGCGLQEEGPEVTGLILGYDRLNVSLGDQCVFEPVFFPQGASGLVDWSSSNPSVASVDGQGCVTANAVGSTVITAAVHGFRDSCTVCVIPRILVAGKDGVYEGTKQLYKGGVSAASVTAGHKIFTSNVSSVANYNYEVTVSQNGEKKYTLYSGELYPAIYAMDVDGENLYTAVTLVGSEMSSRIFMNGRKIWTFENAYGDYSVRSLCVNDGVVYSGGLFDDGRCKAMLWRNGQLRYTLYEGRDYAYVSSIVVSGDDIYALVSIFGELRTFEIYKNGELLHRYSSKDHYNGMQFTNLNCSNLCVSDGMVFYTLSFNNGLLRCVDGNVIKHIFEEDITKWDVRKTALCDNNYYILGFRGYDSVVWMNNEILYEYDFKDFSSMSLITTF